MIRRKRRWRRGRKGRGGKGNGEENKILQKVSITVTLFMVSDRKKNRAPDKMYT